MEEPKYDNCLTDEEREILEIYRSLNPKDKKKILFKAISARAKQVSEELEKEKAEMQKGKIYEVK